MPSTRSLEFTPCVHARMYVGAIRDLQWAAQVFLLEV